jgi:phage gp45-like
MSVESQIERLSRRVLTMIAPARISATDDTGNIHSAQIGISSTPEIIDKVPVTHYYGFHTNVPANTDAIVIFGNGDRSRPVIVGHNNIKARPKNFKPGEVALFTDEGDTLKFSRQQAVSLTAGNSYTLSSKAGTVKGTDTVTIDTPQTHHTGDVHATGTYYGKDFVTGSGVSVEDRLAALEARNAQLEARNAQLEARIAALEARLA